MIMNERVGQQSDASVECVPALVSDEKRPPPVEVSWAETTSELAARMATCENFMLKDLR
jgi:hypothetical protein